MEYLKDSLDTGRLKIDFSTSNQSRDIEVHTLFLILNTMKVDTIYLVNGILGRHICSLPSSGRKAQVSSLSKQGRVTEFSKQSWVYPNPFLANVTLKGYPKKIWAFLVRKLTNHIR